MNFRGSFQKAKWISRRNGDRNREGMEGNVEKVHPSPLRGEGEGWG